MDQADFAISIYPIRNQLNKHVIYDQSALSYVIAAPNNLLRISSKQDEPLSRGVARRSVSV